jgi:predicted RNase H-like HicB family nuclease
MLKNPTYRTFPVIFDREEDGRWIAEIPRVPGALAYGKTRADARARATAIALRALADRIERKHPVRAIEDLFISA